MSSIKLGPSPRVRQESKVIDKPREYIPRCCLGKVNASSNHPNLRLGTRSTRIIRPQKSMKTIVIHILSLGSFVCSTSRVLWGKLGQACMARGYEPLCASFPKRQRACPYCNEKSTNIIDRDAKVGAPLWIQLEPKIYSQRSSRTQMHTGSWGIGPSSYPFPTSYQLAGVRRGSRASHAKGQNHLIIVLISF